MIAVRRLITVLVGVLVAAWVGCTMYAVGRYGGAAIVDPGTTGRLMAVRNDDVVESALGLTYHGVGGGALAVLELLAVPAAAVATLLRRDALRRAGSLVLVAWAALWLGNALWLQTRGWDRTGDVLALALAMLTALAWAGLRWRMPGRRPGPTPLP